MHVRGFLPVRFLSRALVQGPWPLVNLLSIGGRPKRALIAPLARWLVQVYTVGAVWVSLDARLQDIGPFLHVRTVALVLLMGFSRAPSESGNVYPNRWGGATISALKTSCSSAVSCI